jgi:hypothetical protein
VSELAQLSIRVGSAEALFDVKQRGQFRWIRWRRRVKLRWVDGDPDAVPVLQH